MDMSLTGLDHSPLAPLGFFVSGESWLRYGLDALLEGGEAPVSGRVALARALAARMNDARDPARPDLPHARAGELLALELLTRILRHVAGQYFQVFFPMALERGLAETVRAAGVEAVDETLPALAAHFPPAAVRAGRVSARDWLRLVEDGRTGRETAAVEALLLQVTDENPAAAAYRPLHDTRPLRKGSPFTRYADTMESWLQGQPSCPTTGLSLPDTLRAPMRACPDSLEGQIAFILDRWSAWLPQAFLSELLTARGVLREETALRGFGPGPSEALTFHPRGGDDGSAYPEPEAFSSDMDWMPNVVLMAKSVYVWLDQLSRKHGVPVRRLDEIPEIELDQLAGWGFNALWLIGLWERSSVSRDIKRRMGNPEAESSAYSLYDYQIAADLGGDEAYHVLAERAWRRGIRLASDMVPNHVGIYSRWIVEHPDWFIQSPEPPFPNYRFNGPDLSPDDRISLYLEDGYWNKTDAAVVFKWVSRSTGETRYIYHGNDGTSMPWNDTAQLNFMLPEVREAVTQTILHVARKSPIIRFDAAMTLAKKHYQRLWFPRPGDAGAIPSRAEHSLTREQFDAAFPEEFWRQVVDRAAAETENTLLLAEAFWLMEGYFVRTLGMHRVYNSAFMNMLKMEDNGKYRQTLKNVLEFSPEILQRFVNFMNNPDEDTAVAQFGKGDKYFGVAVLLATMPGLPMFGHGQVEGLTEKYGMEYRRAYWDEAPDQDLIVRHEREVFPLLRQRHVFSGAEHFQVYDFTTPDGWVDENVFAFSNRCGGERALVLYNNAYSSSRGVVHTASAVNRGSAEAPRLERADLGAALDLPVSERAYVIFRDSRTGLEYLHYVPELRRDGLHVELAGYEHRVFLDWFFVEDHDLSWARLHEMIGGRGVHSVGDAWAELRLAAVLGPFRELVSPDTFRRLCAADFAAEDRELVAGRLGAFLDAAADQLGGRCAHGDLVEAALEKAAVLRRGGIALTAGRLCPETFRWLQDWDVPGAPLHPGTWRVFLAAILTEPLGAAAARVLAESGAVESPHTLAGRLTSDWFLVRNLAKAFESMDGDGWRAGMDARLVRLLAAHAPALRTLPDAVWGPVLHPLFSDPDAAGFLLLNRFAGRRYLNREQLVRLAAAFCFLEAFDALSFGKDGSAADRLSAAAECMDALTEAAEDTGYDLDWMLETLR
ncbi:MAG TPA: alpha-amylase family glycosyl hydrolase [Candidatus Hydrogenedentes bacterium]|nr:alpha-amylase family glycosyl hydrolase [Candidatus Hydrogenedentota bacterium]